MNKVRGTTFTLTGGDVAADGFSSAILLDTNSRRIKGAEIECDLTVGNAIRYAFNVSPAIDTKHRLGPGQSITLSSYGDCKGFKFINDVALSNAVLWVTPLY
jgi:hypothetical protein